MSYKIKCASSSKKCSSKNGNECKMINGKCVFQVKIIIDRNGNINNDYVSDCVEYAHKVASDMMN